MLSNILKQDQRGGTHIFFSSNITVYQRFADVQALELEAMQMY